MLFVISPAKSLDYETPAPLDLPRTHTRGRRDSAALIKILKGYPSAQLQALMDISEPLAELNRKRFKSWKSTDDAPGATQAMWAFDGDVYGGLQARTLSMEQWAWAQSHVRMLSGLYGVLRPCDLMQPYRLEMGTSLPNRRGASLYAFWGDRVAKFLNADLAEARSAEPSVLVNLASQEYFKAVDRKALKARVVECVFEEGRPDGSYKVISFSAKRARGRMLRWVIEKEVKVPETLASFDWDGYRLAESVSSPDRLVFRRSGETQPAV